MEKLDFRNITKTEELMTVIEKIEHYTGVRLPTDYVNRSQVVGVFLHDRLVAGYMLVTSPAFRSLLFVPDQVKKQHDLFVEDEYEMMEVNGLWISPALKTPLLQVRVWARLIRDIFSARKKYVLLMRHSGNKTMKNLSSMANPKTIFQGTPQILGSDKTHDSIEVAYTTRWSIVLNSHKYFVELLRRSRKAAKFAAQRKSANNLHHPAAKLIEA